MSGLSRKFFFGIAAASGLLCNTVYAQGTTDESQYPEEFIQSVHQAGVMTRIDMVEALRINLQLYFKYPGPLIEYHVGRSYQRLGSCKNAIQFYLKVKSHHLPFDDMILDKTLEMFDEVAFCESWQRFILRCNIPPGNTVMVDDVPIRGCWPNPISLEDGDHVVKLISADGVTEKITKIIHAESGQPDEVIDLSFDVDTAESID